MENSKHLYKVAEHIFEINIGNRPSLFERMQQCYSPFEVTSYDASPLFSVTVSDEISSDDVTDCFFTEKRESIEKGMLAVYITSKGWLFEQTQPFCDDINGRIRIDRDLNHAEISMNGNEMQRWFAFNSAMMLCYLLATAPFYTILTHSSCVMNDGKAYLFLGKSGTGKSTHSSLWLKHIAGTTLLNDDHPVIRANQQGEVTVYGSPWSGKTPCYKNLSAPIGGIVRIKRAPKNSIAQLNAIQAYASLTTSFSGMTWESQMADYRHAVIEKVIENVPCYTLSCLPDEEAARICCSVVTKSKENKV